VSQPEPKTLRDLTNELTVWQDTAAGFVGEIADAQLIEAKIKQLETLHESKVDRYAAFIRWLSAEQDQIQADERRLSQRRRAFQRHEAKLRADAKALMAENSISELKGRASTITLTEGRQRLECDKSLLPAEYLTTVTQTFADEDKIEQALKVGVVIDGARLVNSEPHITIR
jgi:hypothetical protein